MTHSHHFSGAHVLYSIAYICIYNWFLFATPIDDPQSPYTMTFLELLLAVFRFPMVPRQARHFTRNDVASLSCCALCFSSGLAQLGCSEAVRGEICARMKQMDETDGWMARMSELTGPWHSRWPATAPCFRNHYDAWPEKLLVIYIIL